MKTFLFILLPILVLASLAIAGNDNEAPSQTMTNSETAKATLAGGCFWCMQPPFDKLEGVLETSVGYTGGKEINPAYEAVAGGRTGHTEAIEIIYDPAKVSYAELLDVFWMNIDPTQKDGQFADVGKQYRTEIFYHSDTQKKEAEASKEKLSKSGKFSKPIVTAITEASTFYPAEKYHQKYYQKNPVRYKLYRRGSGREGFIERVWGKK